MDLNTAFSAASATNCNSAKVTFGLMTLHQVRRRRRGKYRSIVITVGVVVVVGVVGVGDVVVVRRNVVTQILFCPRHPHTEDTMV